MSWESQIMLVFSYDTFLDNIKTLQCLLHSSKLKLLIHILSQIIQISFKNDPYDKMPIIQNGNIEIRIISPLMQIVNRFYRLNTSAEITFIHIFEGYISRVIYQRAVMRLMSLPFYVGLEQYLLLLGNTYLQFVCAQFL